MKAAGMVSMDRSDFQFLVVCSVSGFLFFMLSRMVRTRIVWPIFRSRSHLGVSHQFTEAIVAHRQVRHVVYGLITLPIRSTCYPEQRQQQVSRVQARQLTCSRFEPRDMTFCQLNHTLARAKGFRKRQLLISNVVFTLQRIAFEVPVDSSSVCIRPS